MYSICTKNTLPRRTVGISTQRIELEIHKSINREVEYKIMILYKIRRTTTCNNNIGIFQPRNLILFLITIVRARIKKKTKIIFLRFLLQYFNNGTR